MEMKCSSSLMWRVKRIWLPSGETAGRTVPADIPNHFYIAFQIHLVDLECARVVAREHKAFTIRRPGRIDMLVQKISRQLHIIRAIRVDHADLVMPCGVVHLTGEDDPAGWLSQLGCLSCCFNVCRGLRGIFNNLRGICDGNSSRFHGWNRSIPASLDSFSVCEVSKPIKSKTSCSVWRMGFSQTERLTGCVQAEVNIIKISAVKIIFRVFILFFLW